MDTTAEFEEAEKGQIKTGKIQKPKEASPFVRIELLRQYCLAIIEKYQKLTYGSE